METKEDMVEVAKRQIQDKKKKDKGKKKMKLKQDEYNKPPPKKKLKLIKKPINQININAKPEDNMVLLGTLKFS